jgi:tRNA-(ms[2]io[6]A)-hydroxylase
MLCLTRSTDPSWVDRAVDRLDEVLIDHAHCEMKAAMNALSLAARAVTPAMASRLAALAEEETQHFREVLAELERRGLALGTSPPDPYAAELRALAHRTRPGGRSPEDTLVDRFLVAALIEARSCERFRLLADALARSADRGDLAAFYEGLFAAEARHYRTFLDFAIEAAGGDEPRVRLRLGELAEGEGQLAGALGVAPEIHG